MVIYYNSSTELTGSTIKHKEIVIMVMRMMIIFLLLLLLSQLPFVEGC